MPAKRAPASAGGSADPVRNAGQTPAETGYPQPRVWINGTEEVRNWGLKLGELAADGDWLAVAPGKKAHYTLALGHRSFANPAIRVVFSNEIEVALRQSSKSKYSGHVGKHATIGIYELGIGTHDLLAPVELASGYVADTN